MKLLMTDIESLLEGSFKHDFAQFVSTNLLGRLGRHAWIKNYFTLASYQNTSFAVLTLNIKFVKQIKLNYLMENKIIKKNRTDEQDR